jgi:hypothetical protein
MVAEDSQYGFYRLVRSFRLPVHLRVIGRAHVLLDFELGTKFLEELRGEPRVSVRDNSFRNSGVGERVVPEEPRNLFAPHVFSARDQDYGFCTIMVGDGEDRITAA